MHTARLVIVILGLVGCGSASPAGSPTIEVMPPPTMAAPTVAAQTAAPTPTPSASPTPDLSATAAAEYLKVTTAANDAMHSLWGSRACKGEWTQHTLKQRKTCYAKRAKLERAWADDVRAISFPAELDGDVQALLRSSAKAESLMIAASHSRSRADLCRTYAKLESADDEVVALSNALRGALGLPSVS